MRFILKHITFMYLVVIVGTAVFFSISFRFAKAEELISCWKFEEGSGTIAIDSVNGNDGTLIGGPTWTAGIVGTALSFDVGKQMVVVPHSPNLNVGNSTDSYSIEAWFNTNFIYPSDPKLGLNDSGTILGKDDGISRYPFQFGVGFFDEATTNQGYFQIHPGPGVDVTVSTQAAVNDGNWHHMVGIRDRSAGKVLLYLDGVKVSEAADGFSSIDNADNVTIGCGSDQPIGSNICHQRDYFGLIDEVAIYNGVLSEAEIQQHYQNGLIGVGYCPETLSCIGFEPPMDGGPVAVKKNRVLPFKATLADQNGQPITGTDLSSPPVIQVIFDSGIAPAEDVTDQALSAGQGTEGNQFEYGTDKWQFNLETKNYTATGTYTTSMESGDTFEYIIDPSCVGIFVIE